MQLGIFAKTFSRPTFEESLDAVVDQGLKRVQFNLSSAGLPTLPETMNPDRCIMIARAFQERGLVLDAISGTFNMIQDSPIGETDCDRSLESLESSPTSAAVETSVETESLRRLEMLASACRWLDTRIITLCTGTCDPGNMWRWHPDNVKRGAWKQLVVAMKQVARIADRHEVTMAIEPETGNVVNSAVKARMLLDEIGSPWIRVVIDPANLFHPGDLPRMREFLDEAFEWLGPDIVLAHAKELSPDGHPGGLAPGQGVLDWDHYLGWLKTINYRGPLIIHGLPESAAAEATAFLRSKLETPAGEN
jgi:sugar phosphate isomerase/epimerase